MKGIELELILNAMLDTFSADDMRRLLLVNLDLRMEDIVGDVLGKRRAFLAILTEVEQLGLLSPFVAALAHERPMRSDVQAVFKDYASALVSEAKRQQIDKKVADAYARFGLAPPIIHQQAGVTRGSLTVGDAGLERTIREDLGFLDVAAWRDRLFQLEGRICRVELNDAVGTMGTGFLVGPDTLLTNYHVLENVIDGPHSAARVKFRFDYKTLPNGQPANGMLAELAGVGDAPLPWLLGMGKYSAAEKAGTPDAAPPAPGELDFALVRLGRKIGEEPVGSGGPARGWVEVPVAPAPVAGIPAIMILQHPNGAPLKLAFDTRPGIEVRYDGMRVRYATNTEGGSSGSPVFDKDWKLVALHHYGDPAFHHPKYNQGIPIGPIRDALSVAARGLLGGPSM